MIENMIEELTKEYNGKLAQKQLLENQIKQVTNKVNTEKQEISELNQVLAILKSVSKCARELAKSQLETIVTDSLRYIHGDTCRFEIELTEQRKVPSAEFYIISDVNGQESKQIPTEACGGGYIDVISTALRYAYIKAYNNPEIKNAIILDEPGKMLSENASVKFAEFIKQLGNLFSKQTIMVTHNDALKTVADKSFDVRKVNSCSIVSETNNIAIKDLSNSESEDILNEITSKE